MSTADREQAALERGRRIPLDELYAAVDVARLATRSLDEEERAGAEADLRGLKRALGERLKGVSESEEGTPSPG